VQGWHGSHVVILADGREVPFDTVLFAARLAAGYSKAAGGDNVPVDYTTRKNVWKVKGGPPGAVRYTQQKTVYVTPSRNPAAEDAAAGDEA
jgi:predicted ribosome quality control (RQC) complex YloA/Tae2 family protein